MGKSSIEWTDETWNPIAGCTKVSAGCKHCYAERMAKRLVAMGQEKYAGTVDDAGRWTGTIRFNEEALSAPFRWRKPRMVFVNSMSDLFHHAVPYEWIAQIFAVMALTPQHTYQVLTKRPERMRVWAADSAARTLIIKPDDSGDWKTVRWPYPWPLPNVWLGVSVEDQAAADARIPALLECPAAVRFLSCEPLLGPVNVSQWLRPRQKANADGYGGEHGPGWTTDLRVIDWVICGGESGPGARPMHPDWARSLRDQCQAAGVPFFFKQFGTWINEDIALSLLGDDYELSKRRATVAHNEIFYRLRKHSTGRLLDGREWNQLPGGEHAKQT